ncbi:MAG: hypothetical protein PHT91_00230 [Candidatus Nanoarchaeia archaeon]|nr:hypothetical protein [Candidatus Nanoarchaeia archaeon]MDD5054217.1 hypothetical protein [Candidatus Nanoarchaeia archaeon]MDD5499287.1 hypothetical protein [Candidatus Nanoarchaeia archaeon]
MDYSEGLVKISIGKRDLVPSKKDDIFLNEHKSFDRDINVLLVKALGWKNKAYLEVMSGSGIRGLRLAEETAAFSKIVFNDLKKSAVNNIKKNIGLNKIKGCEVHDLDAHELLKTYEKGIDYIDIDPFGSPVYYVVDAMKKLSRNGILSVCATDTGALSGTFPSACRRRYHSNSYLSEFYYESGLRILIKECISLASSYDVALIPIFAHATRHYFRAYFRKVKGAKTADELIKKIGFISYCPKCLNRQIGIKCECVCKEKMILIGPLFAGKLYDEKLVKKMASFGKHEDFFGKILSEAEVDSPWFYTTDSICKKHKISIEPRIKELGFNKTHIHPKGFKTDKNIFEILKKF